MKSIKLFNKSAPKYGFKTIFVVFAIVVSLVGMKTWSESEDIAGIYGDNQKNVGSHHTNHKLITNLIEPVKYYINNKDQIKDLTEKLHTHHKAGLVGISGIGKTQLARTYAYTNRNNYDLIWFFDTNTDLNYQFMQLARSLNQTLTALGEHKLEEDYSKAKQSVMDFLTSKKGWLFILDNLKINENYKLKEFMAWENNGHIIFCSQDSKDIMQAIALPNLNKADSLKLVHNITHSDSVVYDRLVDELNGYPILLTQAAMFLQNNNYVKFEDYKQLMDKSDTKLKTHLQSVLKELDRSTRGLLARTVLVNNQQFSKELLRIISQSQATLDKDLYNMVRFGLVVNTKTKGDNQVFEMHDIIKNTLLDIFGEKLNKSNIEDLLDKMVAELRTIPFEKTFVMMGEDLASNLEVLINNAEKHKVKPTKIMAIRESLLDFYMNSRQVSLSKKMIDWLAQQEASNNLNVANLTDSDKAVYASYLLNVGAYECFFSQLHPKVAINTLNKAVSIVNKLDGFYKNKVLIYCQLAQIQAYAGANKDALANVKITEDILRNHPEVKDEIGLGAETSNTFTKAKVYLTQGNYSEALANIDLSIGYTMKMSEGLNDVDHTVVTYSAPFYTLKAEILNSMGNFLEANNIAEIIYKQEFTTANEQTESTAYALTQMSRAQLGLKNPKNALNYARQAIEFYLNDEARNNKKLGDSTDFHLAEAFKAEADALVALQEREKAAEAYAKAEKIYFNRSH